MLENLNIREAFEDLVRDIFFDPLFEKLDKEFLDPRLETDNGTPRPKGAMLSRSGIFNERRVGEVGFRRRPMGRRVRLILF